MSLLKTFMDPDADFRQRARARIQERNIAELDRAAGQQEKRAAKMSKKIGRGNRRAAKASMRAAALREQSDHARHTSA